MKLKLAAVALIGSLVSSPSYAWGGHHYHSSGAGVAAGVIGGLAGLVLLQQLTQPQVVVQPVPVYPSYPVYPTYYPNCRQVLTVQIDRFGNEYRYPSTVCN